jgi:hypothetical protein
MKVEVELHGLAGVLKTLESLPAEVVAKRGGPVRAALRKGALVIQKAELANLDRVLSNTNDEGKLESTGLLKKNVVVSRGKAPSGGKGERALVRVRRKPYTRKGKTVTTIKTGALLEHGSERQPAEPWVRPAFNAKAPEAISTIESELIGSIDKIVKRLASTNKSR